MKIWKTSLQGLLEEIVGPLYLSVLSQRARDSAGTVDLITYYVALSGFNQAGHAIELRLERPPVPTLFQEDCEREMKENQQTASEVKERLDALGRLYLDGVLSETHRPRDVGLGLQSI